MRAEMIVHVKAIVQIEVSHKHIRALSEPRFWHGKNHSIVVLYCAARRSRPSVCSSFIFVCFIDCGTLRHKTISTFRC